MISNSLNGGVFVLLGVAKATVRPTLDSTMAGLPEPVAVADLNGMANRTS